MKDQKDLKACFKYIVSFYCIKFFYILPLKELMKFYESCSQRHIEQDSYKSLNFIHFIKAVGGGGGKHSISTFYSVKSCIGYSSVQIFPAKRRLQNFNKA